MKETGGFIISSDRSDSGKTTITLGMMKLFSKKYKVAPFKVGPDFIDPMYHKLASGNYSVNLDLWIMGKNGVVDIYNKYSKFHDLSIIEGVMGFYDGLNGRYSTWELSDVLNKPVILIIDCSRNSTTAAAIVNGLKNYRRNHIRGVIFNKVASESHYNDCKMKLPRGIKSLGWVPYNDYLKIGSRHLGLLTPRDESEDFINNAAESVENNIDIDSIDEIMRIDSEHESNNHGSVNINKEKAAIAYDNAFSFYYHDNIENLRNNYDLEFFSPIKNQIVNEPSFIYLGGGYPELFAEDLQTNTLTKDWLKREVEKGTKILAECGGMMYLSRNLQVEKNYKMAGIFDVDVAMGKRITIGYTELKARDNNILSKKGSKIRGHEFHKSEISDIREKRVFDNIRGRGVGDGTDGFQYQNTLALYSHSFFSFTKGKLF